MTRSRVNAVARKTNRVIYFGRLASVAAFSVALSFASLLVLELYIDEVSDPCVDGIVT